MFGIDNLCWMSANATSEASRLAEFLILQTGMTAFGKAYYRNKGDLVANVCVGFELFQYTLLPLTKVFYAYKQVTADVQVFCTACNKG